MKFQLPDFAVKKLKRLYPDVDVDGLVFHRDEMPWYIRGHGAVTIGNHIYFRRDWSLRLAVHELCHVRQGAAGFGIWLLRPFYLRYVWEWIKAGFSYRDNALEVEAYSMERRIYDGD